MSTGNNRQREQRHSHKGQREIENIK